MERLPHLFQQRDFLKARFQKRREQRLMAARRQKARDLPPIFPRSGHKNAHTKRILLYRRLGVKQPHMTGKPLTILGIETSCDETAAAVVRGRIPGPGEILSNIVFKPDGAHAPPMAG